MQAGNRQDMRKSGSPERLVHGLRNAGPDADDQCCRDLALGPADRLANASGNPIAKIVDGGTNCPDKIPVVPDRLPAPAA